MSGRTPVNQYFQSKKHRGDSVLKGRRLETNIQTPKMRMQNSANDQLIISNLQNVPLQLRQSRSFRLKNPRYSLKIYKTRKQTHISETQNYNVRIMLSSTRN